MFESVYTSSVTPLAFFLTASAALVCGLIFSWIMSFRIRSSKRFFLVTTLLPLSVSTVITFVNGNIGAGVAIGGAFGLIRFRSAQGSADEIASILIAMGSGIAFGMGYILYGASILIGLAVLYYVTASLDIFEHASQAEDMLLRITIPESLEYSGVFDETFDKYLRTVKSAGVKTTAMGSMFRLSYLIRLKDPSCEKAFIDELRIKNGNLEISLVPYAEQGGQL